MLTPPRKRAFANFLREPVKFFSDEARNLIVIMGVGFSQGLINSSDIVFNYICKDDYRLSPTQSSFFNITNKVPWMIKPLWGTISDNFRLLGYRRKSYIAVMAIVAWICLISFGLWIPSVALGFFLLVVFNVALSFETCMAQAVLVQNAQKAVENGDPNGKGKDNAASKGISLFFGARYVGTIIGSVLVIFLFTETKKKEYMLGISFVPLALFALSFLLPEKRYKQKNSPTRRLEMQNFDSHTNSLAESEPPAAGPKISNLKKALNFLKNPVIRKSILLMFLSSFVPQSPQAKFYYYTLYLNFDGSFLGSLDFIGISAILLAIAVYDRWLKNVEIKKFYTGTLLLACVLTLTQLIQIFRINVGLGISDKIFAALDTFIIELVLEFSSLPVLVLACKMCPKDIEATIFALMLSVSNAGGLISLQLGTVFTHFLGITEENFDNLWIMILTSAVFYLVPLTVLFSMDFNEKVKHEEEEIQQKQGYEEHVTVDPTEDGLEEDREDLVPMETTGRTSELSPIRKELYSKLIADDKLYAFS